MSEKWLTVIQTATISGYHPDYIRQLLRDGRVAGRKWGQAWQVDRESLQQYLLHIGRQGKKRGPKPEKGV